MSEIRLPDHQIAGDGDVTVFLLHGAYGSKAYFQFEIETLVRNGLRVVAWDAPGYGLSPLPDNLSIELLAEAAARLIDKTGTARNIVLGHSMGGVVAPAVYALRPERVHGLVVSATVAAFSRKSEEDRKSFLAERIEPLRNGKSFRETAMPVILSMFAKGSKGPMVDLVREVAASTRTETFCAAINAIVQYEGIPNLKKVRVPTLLIAGAQDKVGRPDGMEAIKDLIPHAEFVCIPDAGHYAFAEQHEAFNRHVLAFAKRFIAAPARQGAKLEI